jgi:hypothetical protein
MTEDKIDLPRLPRSSAVQQWMRIFAPQIPRPEGRFLHEALTHLAQPGMGCESAAHRNTTRRSGRPGKGHRSQGYHTSDMERKSAAMADMAPGRGDIWRLAGCLQDFPLEAMIFYESAGRDMTRSTEPNWAGRETDP